MPKLIYILQREGETLNMKNNEKIKDANLKQINIKENKVN